MIFFGEAAAALHEAFGNDPGWIFSPLDNGVEWVHPASGTTLRMFGSGDIAVINERLLVEEVVRYDDALRRCNSMDGWVELGHAFASRDARVLVRWFGPYNIKVR